MVKYIKSYYVRGSEGFVRMYQTEDGFIAGFDLHEDNMDSPPYQTYTAETFYEMECIIKKHFNY